MSKLNMPLKDGLFGDWDSVGRWFTEKYSTFDKFGDKPMLECANLYYKELTDGIRNQSFDWVALSEVYSKRKLASGRGALILISSGFYLEGIKIRKSIEQGGKLAVFVGADSSEIHSPSGLAMSYIGAIHEYGSGDGRVPSRPHYRPTWERLRNDCRNIWLKHLREFSKVK